MSTTTEPKKKSKRKEKISVTRGKRKESVARAVATPGTGNIFINKAHLSTITDSQLRTTISEPFDYYDKANALDVHVTVYGGGRGGQAQAARTAIARALVAHSKGDEVKERMLQADRTLLVEDPRRVEPKKFKGPKARARFTKSYR